MPEIQQVIAQVIAVLTAAGPAVLALSGRAAGKAIEGAGGEAGKAGARKAADLFNKVKGWFKKDKNAKAQKTLELFTEDPATFETALSKYLLETLQKHPDWVDEVRSFMAEPATQKIVAKNAATVQRVEMSLQGSGSQSIEADHGDVFDIKMTIKNS